MLAALCSYVISICGWFAFCSAVVIRASCFLWLILKVIIHKEGLHIIMILIIAPCREGEYPWVIYSNLRVLCQVTWKGGSHNNIKVKWLFLSLRWLLKITCNFALLCMWLTTFCTGFVLLPFLIFYHSFSSSHPSLLFLHLKRRVWLSQSLKFSKFLSDTATLKSPCLSQVLGSLLS